MLKEEIVDYDQMAKMRYYWHAFEANISITVYLAVLYLTPYQSQMKNQQQKARKNLQEFEEDMVCWVRLPNCIGKYYGVSCLQTLV